MSAKRGGITLDPRTILVGGGVAAVGVVVLAMFLWMVPTAAARESVAACRGVHGGGESSEKMRFGKGDPLCPPGQSCTLPQPAPDFEAIDHSGKKVKLSSLRGKTVLLNFWGSWCNVCKTEKPALEQMARELAGDDFVVIALASDHSWVDVLLSLVHAIAPAAPLPSAPVGGKLSMDDALGAYQKALPNGTGFDVWLDPPRGDGSIGEIAHAWGVDAVPDSVLIDKKGMIQAYFVNKRDWESSVAQTCLRSVIDKD